MLIFANLRIDIDSGRNYYEIKDVNVYGNDNSHSQLTVN